MTNDMVMVKSAADAVVVMNLPELAFRRVWQKKGAKYPIDRKILLQAYYNPGVTALFEEGILVTDDEAFLVEVGLKEEGGEVRVVELTDAYKVRLVKTMPLMEVEREIKKLTRSQIEELVDYAITHYTEISMDRIDLFTKISGKDVMGAIKIYRASLED